MNVLPNDTDIHPVSVGKAREAGGAVGARLRFSSNIAGPILLAGDLLCLIAAVPIALAAYRLMTDQNLVTSVHVFAFCATASAFVLLRLSRRSYRQSLVSLADHGDPIIDAIASVLIASAVVWQFGLIENFSRGITLLYAAALVLTLMISRPLIHLSLRGLARRGLIEQRVAFYGADPESLDLIRQTLGNLDLPHVRFIGVADDRPKGEGPKDLEFIGGIDALIDLARAGDLDQVLLCTPGLNAERVAAIVEQLSDVSVDVAVIPPLAIKLAPSYEVHLLGKIPVLMLWKRPFRDINGLIKRTEDLIISVIAFVLLSPLLLIAALLVRLSGPGPILFIQPRVGFNNEVINVYKFRTMHTENVDFGGRATTTRDDPRVTAVGYWLRRLSIDELPQLLNVIRGDMSLVGPRPHAIHMKVGDRYYHDAVRGYASRHRVKPGITGLAQVSGLRGEIRTIDRAERRVMFDKRYIETWSLGLDLRILGSTVRAILWDKDAY
ncbi:MAG: exopolysaccharide biosynthesis polyprenyl glycosylphosphotransferase [Sphingomonas bacterium]|nr:exopolysaccharide biosynthesis polyprenyl glycosylphosphotransferase [Sphingomonas bacterium]